jgi:hypothetical protein
VIISIVRALEISDGDNFYDCVHYNFAGVFDEAAGKALAAILTPEGLPGWVAAGCAGEPLFKVNFGELKGIGDIGKLIESVLNSIEET